MVSLKLAERLLSVIDDTDCNAGDTVSKGVTAEVPLPVSAVAVKEKHTISPLMKILNSMIPLL